MKLPDIVYGTENEGSVRLRPDIPEQLALAIRLKDFLDSTTDASIQPSLRSRSLKDFRSKQPKGRAKVSVAFSNEKHGRYAAEVHASHHPSGVESHYRLTADGEHWLRTEDTTKDGQVNVGYVSHDDMVLDMLEYSRADGAVNNILDEVASAQNIILALFKDMGPSAHHKRGSDHFRTAVPLLGGDHFAGAQHIEVVDSRVNNLVTRQLSITALTTIANDPVDVTQCLVYQVRHDNHGRLLDDDVRLVHRSADGLSSPMLQRFAETSDVAIRDPIKRLHTALDELSRDVFLGGQGA